MISLYITAVCKIYDLTTKLSASLKETMPCALKELISTRYHMGLRIRVSIFFKKLKSMVSTNKTMSKEVRKTLKIRVLGLMKIAFAFFWRLFYLELLHVHLLSAFLAPNSFTMVTRSHIAPFKKDLLDFVLIYWKKEVYLNLEQFQGSFIQLSPPLRNKKFNKKPKLRRHFRPIKILLLTKRKNQRGLRKKTKNCNWARRSSRSKEN